MVTPRKRRHGFTPRMISSIAHHASDTPTTTLSRVWGVSVRWTKRWTKDATRKIARLKLGNWATVTLPVFGLRNIQSKVDQIRPARVGDVCSRPRQAKQISKGVVVFLCNDIVDLLALYGAIRAGRLAWEWHKPGS